MKNKKIKANIFLQARSNSKRLPFKSLIKLNKIPLAVLCAKRLSGKKIDVTVLTSDEKNDDYLTEVLNRNKINFFRGSLDNVYKRFYDCAKKLNNDDVIIRATADNPFVNYDFVVNVLEDFLKNNEIYKGIDHKKHNLPYGMSIEIFRKSLLLKYRRKLNKNAIIKLAQQLWGHQYKLHTENKRNIIIGLKEKDE